jgi:hypothetical protein
MAASYPPVSPTVSEHHDKISTVSSPARPEYYPLGDISKGSDFKVASSQSGQGWGQEEATTVDLLASGIHQQSKIAIPRFDSSRTNS